MAKDKDKKKDKKEKKKEKRKKEIGISENDITPLYRKTGNFSIMTA